MNKLNKFLTCLALLLSTTSVQADYTWVKHEGNYALEGNLIYEGYYSSWEEAYAVANSIPEVTRFFYVKPGHRIWGYQGMDYATDSEVLYQGGYAGFYSDVSLWKGNGGSSAYFKIFHD